MAAGLISDGEIIAIGAGTTTTQVARSIRHRKAITVLTNALNIAMELSHLAEIKVCMTGGFLSGDWFALVGDVAQQNVSQTFLTRPLSELTAPTRNTDSLRTIQTRQRFTGP